jgi:hypothetical protein
MRFPSIKHDDIHIAHAQYSHDHIVLACPRSWHPQGTVYLTYIVASLKFFCHHTQSAVGYIVAWIHTRVGWGDDRHLVGPVTWVFARVPHGKAQSALINRAEHNWVGPAPLSVNTEKPRHKHAWYCVWVQLTYSCHKQSPIHTSQKSRYLQMHSTKSSEWNPSKTSISSWNCTPQLNTESSRKGLGLQLTLSSNCDLNQHFLQKEANILSDKLSKVTLLWAHIYVHLQMQNSISSYIREHTINLPGQITTGLKE